MRGIYQNKSGSTQRLYYMTDEAKIRKGQPIYSGVVSYFPKALRYVSEISQAGNDQHHPGTPLHWDRSKSGDELDALMRHLTNHAEGTIRDKDGKYHLGKVAWRSLAALEKLLENE